MHRYTYYNHYRNVTLTTVLPGTATAAFLAIIRDTAPPVKEAEDFVRAKFYCPHTIADSNYCIWIIQIIMVKAKVLNSVTCTVSVP